MQGNSAGYLKVQACVIALHASRITSNIVIVLQARLKAISKINNIYIFISRSQVGCCQISLLATQLCTIVQYSTEGLRVGVKPAPPHCTLQAGNKQDNNAIYSTHGNFPIDEILSRGRV